MDTFTFLTPFILKSIIKHTCNQLRPGPQPHIIFPLSTHPLCFPNTHFLRGFPTKILNKLLFSLYEAHVQGHRRACAVFHGEWHVTATCRQNHSHSAISHYRLLKMLDIFSMCSSRTVCRSHQYKPSCPPCSEHSSHRTRHAPHPAGIICLSSIFF
jgi:hypothetical protein